MIVNMEVTLSSYGVAWLYSNCLAWHPCVDFRPNVMDMHAQYPCGMQRDNNRDQLLIACLCPNCNRPAGIQIKSNKKTSLKLITCYLVKNIGRSEHLQDFGVIDVSIHIKVFKFVDGQCLK